MYVLLPHHLTVMALILGQLHLKKKNIYFLLFVFALCFFSRVIALGRDGRPQTASAVLVFKDWWLLLI